MKKSVFPVFALVGVVGILLGTAGCGKSAEDAHAAFHKANFDYALEDFTTFIFPEGVTNRVEMLGSPEVIAEAVKIAQKTDMQNPGVLLKLGFCQLCGLGGLSNCEAEGVATLLKASEKNIQAQNVLISHFLWKKDDVACAEWLKKFAETGKNRAAKLFYATALLKGEHGIGKDVANSIKLLSEMEDEPKACLALAECYANGTGVEKDYGKACECWAKVAESGNRDDKELANLRLGLSFMNGQGVKKDLEKAKQHFQYAYVEHFPEGVPNGVETTAAAHAGRLYIEEGRDLSYGVKLLVFALQGEFDNTSLKASTLRLAKEWVGKVKQLCVLGETLGAPRKAKRYYGNGLGRYVMKNGQMVRVLYEEFDVDSKNMVDEWNPPLEDGKLDAVIPNRPWTLLKEPSMQEEMKLCLNLYHSQDRRLLQIEAAWSLRDHGDGGFDNEYFEKRCAEISQYYGVGAPRISKVAWSDDDKLFSRKSTVATWDLEYVTVRLVSKKDGMVFRVALKDGAGKQGGTERAQGDVLGFFPDRNSKRISGFLGQPFGVAITNPRDYTRKGDAGERNIRIKNNKLGFTDGEMKVVARSKKLYEITAIMTTADKGKFKDVTDEIERALGVLPAERQETARSYRIQGDAGTYEIVVTLIDNDDGGYFVGMTVTLKELQSIAE